MAVLDVRPLLAAGSEPFSTIMAAVARLSPGEALELIAPFEPVPLYQVMEARGFSYSIARAQDGSWRVTFQRPDGHE